MGQFGAQGYAELYGWNASQILDHFYGGTQAGSVTNQLISVRLVTLDGIDLHVTAGVPFRVAGYQLAAGQAVVIHADGPNSYQIRGESSCGANDFPWVAVTGFVSVTPLEASNDDLGRMLRLCGGASYRGEFALAHADGAMRTTNVVSIEDYLRGVVPRESPSWFHLQALAAQAVAARSYAMGEGGEFGRRYSYAKTCDTTACQVYNGAGIIRPDGRERYETASTDLAVAQTAGVVRRMSGGGLARTEFSSSTGGWTAGGVFPAVEDLGDAIGTNPRHSWSKGLQASSVSARYGIGQLLDITVTARNGLGEWGGRVRNVRITGVNGSVTRTGDEFRADWVLNSNWFTTDATDGPSAVSSTPGGADVFARDSGAGLAHLAPGAEWASLDGILTSDPDASSPGDGRLDVFARGADNGLYLRSRASAGAPFGGWTSLGGTLTASPTAVSVAGDRTDVFVRGTDSAIWTRTRVGSAWSPWTSLGGFTNAAPDVTTQGDGSINLFVRGGDSQLWHRAFYMGTWHPWEPLGGALFSGPGVAARAGRVDVVVRASDGSSWSRTWAGSWGSWAPLGGQFISDLDAAVVGPAGLDVVGRGLDGAIWRRSLRGGAWGQWHSLESPG